VQTKWSDRVRVLTSSDAGAYQRLRTEMLLDSPASFLSAPGDDIAEDRAVLAKKLDEAENKVLAIEGEDGAGLIAAGGIYRSPRLKMRHYAMIWGVYTSPAWRRRGCSRALMEGAIGLARSWDGVEMINIGVSVNAPSALRLYESLGFVAWGREPRVTRVGAETFDEIHLAMEL